MSDVDPTPPPSFEEAVQNEQPGRQENPSWRPGIFGSSRRLPPGRIRGLPSQGYAPQGYSQMHFQPGYTSPVYSPQGYIQAPSVGGALVFIQQPQQQQQRQESPVYVPNPDSDTEIANSLFSNKTIRAAFVRQVYAILMVQLLATTGIISLFIFVDDVRYFVLDNLLLYISAFIVFFVTVIAITCCGNIARNYPCNLLLLALLTLSLGYLTGVMSAYHDTEIVLMAMSITTGVCLVVSVFACQTRWDITGYGAYLCVGLLVLMVLGMACMLVCLVVGCQRVLILVYASIGALLFSLYLMYDTQRIIGGRKIEISPEEYVYGALHLYVDIINIFIYILTIISVSTGR